MEETINVQTVAGEIIVEELETLRDMEVGTEQYKATVDGVAKLMDRAIEMNKIDNELYEKEKQREEEKKDRLIRNILTGAGIAIPAALTIWGTLKSLKFEETGTVTTIVGRGFINKLLPKK